MLFRLIAPLATISCVLLSIVPSAKAGEIGDVSQEVFNCMRKNTSSSLGRIEYEGDNSGIIRAYPLIGGEVGRVDFSYNLDSRTLNISNPQGIAGEQIEGGLRDTADRCRSGELS